MVSDDESCALFFLPAGHNDDPDPDRWAAGVIQRAGIRHWTLPFYRVVPSESGTERAPGILAELDGLQCDIAVFEQPPFRVLCLTYSIDHFYRIASRDARTLAEDRGRGLAEAFRDACDALRPAGAFLFSRPFEVVDAPLPELADCLAQGDVWDLSTRETGLLYVPDGLAAALDDALEFEDREVLASVSGRVAFAGFGERRWRG